MQNLISDLGKVAGFSRLLGLRTKRDRKRKDKHLHRASTNQQPPYRYGQRTKK